MSENKFDIRLLKRSSLSVTGGLKDGYSKWRNFKKDTGGPFFAIYKDMSEYLSKISHGALKLYVYYGFASKNDTGDSWHAVTNVAKALDVSPRTVDKWNNELEELGFIRRVAAGKKSKTVFLLPLSDYVFELKSINQLNKWLLTEEFKEIYGEPMNSFHLVQTPEIRKKIINRHYYIMITKKKYGKLNTRYTLFKTLVNNSKLVPAINHDEMVDKICRLKEHKNLLSYNNDIEIEHWYVNDDIKLNDDKTLLEFVLTLALNDVDKESYGIVGWNEN